MYNILYLDLDQEVYTLVSLNYVSFQYGLSNILPLESSMYSLEYIITKNNQIQTAQDAVLGYLQSQTDISSIIRQQHFVIIAGTSNQLAGSQNALRIQGGSDYVENTLCLTFSALSSLPPSPVVSVLYSSEKETEATVLHQTIQNVRTTVFVYEKGNLYCEDYLRLYQQKTLVRHVEIIPLVLGQEEMVVQQINHYLKHLSPKTWKHLEILMVIYTAQANLIIPQIHYKKGIRVLCSLTSDGLNPQGVSKRVPVMLCKVATLDITSTTREYNRYMLKYSPVRPSSIAPAFFDMGIQLGQMMALQLSMTVHLFCQRLTVSFSGETAFFGAGWIDESAKRSIFASYYFMYTYDPIMGSASQLEQYQKRSPWMPVLPTSAGVPYQISFVFWVQPSNWIVYYNDWRFIQNVQQPYDYLKLYLGLDTGFDTKDESGQPLAITGYNSYILGVYFKQVQGQSIPYFDPVPQNLVPIFQYPFSVQRPVLLSLRALP